MKKDKLTDVLSVESEEVDAAEYFLAFVDEEDAVEQIEVFHDGVDSCIGF